MACMDAGQKALVRMPAVSSFLSLPLSDFWRLNLILIGSGLKYSYSQNGCSFNDNLANTAATLVFYRQFELSKLQSMRANRLVHVLTRLESVCCNNPTTSVICVSFTPVNQCCDESLQCCQKKHSV